MGEGQKQIEEETLTRLLLERQPEARKTLESLHRYFDGKSGPGVFAPIKGQVCGVCNLAVAAARVQSAKKGVFIPCTSCGRLLYWLEAVLTEDGGREQLAARKEPLSD